MTRNMKRTIRTILYAAIFVAATASCQKADLSVDQMSDKGEGMMEICINALIGEYSQSDATKSSLVNTVRVSWESGDSVFVFDGSKYLGKLYATLDGDEDRYTKLSGTVEAPVSATKLTLVHSPLLSESAADSATTYLSIDMSSQDGETAPFVAYATLSYSNETVTDEVVPFHFATSVIRLNCTGLEASTTIDSAALNGVQTICKLSFKSDGAPEVTGETGGTIVRKGDANFGSAEVNFEGETVFQMAVPKLASVTENRILTVTQGGKKSFDWKFSKKSLDNGMSVNTVCQIGLPPAITTAEFNLKPDGSEYYMLTGVITSISNLERGNMYIEDDTEEKAYIYGLILAPGGTYKDNVGEKKNLEVGDTLTVVGAKSTYKESAQMKNGLYYAHKKGNKIPE